MFRYFLPKKGKRAGLERDFFDKILDMDYDYIILTILSSLWDFPFDGSIEELQDKVKEVYNVDITDIKDGNLDSIFRRIQKKGNFFESKKQEK